MGDGCASCLTRNVVFWFNLVFLFAGLGVIGCGVYALVQKEIVEWAGATAAYITIGVGALIFIIAICALLGARRKVRKCWMWIYTMFLLLFILAQIAAVVIALTQEGRALEFLQERWEDDLTQEQKDRIMESLECGASNTPPVQCKPSTCFQNLPVVSDILCSGEDKCFQDCYDMIKDDFTTVGSVVTIVSLVVVGVEFILLLSACCLLCEDEEDENGFYGEPTNNFSV